MSIEIRHVVTGNCDCGTPRYSWEHTTDHDHHWECDYGRIPSFDANNPAPLIITGRDFVRDVYVNGGKRRIGEVLYAITFVEEPALRLFQRIEHNGRSWTWELEPAHWADPPTRHNNARLPIYLGRWPD